MKHVPCVKHDLGYSAYLTRYTTPFQVIQKLAPHPVGVLRQIDFFDHVDQTATNRYVSISFIFDLLCKTYRNKPC